MCDLYFSSRYHPQIFAASAGVPGVCIYYEHKAHAFLEQLGLGHLAFPIDRLDGEAVKAALDEVVEHREKLAAHLVGAVPALREAARVPNALVARAARASG